MKTKLFTAIFTLAFLMLCFCACSQETPVTPDNSPSGLSLECTMSDEELGTYSYRPQITETMPVIHITTSDSDTSFATMYTREDKLSDSIEYVDAEIAVTDCEEDHLLTGIEAEVKVRGNYTLEYSKKPLRIKFSEKQNLLGLHNGEKYKNWVLLADWKDLSMSNNTTAFYLGKTILGSDGYYCTDFRNVEVYINGSYWGVYLLAEQQEVKDGRMSVPEVEDDYTGTDIGYMFEFDGYYIEERDMPNGSGDPTFEVNYVGQGGSSLQPGYTVKSDINDDAQLSFIQFFTENAYKMAYEAVNFDKHSAFNVSYTDIEPITGTSVKDTVSRFIDLQSLVDIYILNEICCDPDIAWSSFYMSLDMTEKGSKKLIFEAPWDFDSAFGIKYNYTNTVGMFAATTDNPWLRVFANEPWFIEMVKEKWCKLKQADVLETALSLIEEQQTVYEDYYRRNFSKWSERVDYGNHELTDEVNSFKSQGEASDYLSVWLRKRFEYLDERWG